MFVIKQVVKSIYTYYWFFGMPLFLRLPPHVFPCYLFFSFLFHAASSPKKERYKNVKWFL